MSLFGSISGFFSAIGRTGGDSHESGSISESISESSSIQSVADTQTSSSRRTSAVSLVPPVTAILDTPEVDLSHLSEEERAQISAVIARAKTLQTLEDMPGVESNRRPAGSDQSISFRFSESERESTTGNDTSATVSAICRLPDKPASSSISGSGGDPPTCLSCCSDCGGKSKKCTHCSEKSESSLDSKTLHSTESESLPRTQTEEPEAEVEDDAYDLDQTPLPIEADMTSGPTEKFATCSRGEYPAPWGSSSLKGVDNQDSPTDFVCFEDTEMSSPTQRIASHRPKDLLLGNLSSLSSSSDSVADTTSWSSDGVMCHAPEPKSTSEPQLAVSTGDRQPPTDNEEATVTRAEPRCRSRSFDGWDRKRPSAAKDRGAGHSTVYHDCDRNQSPSRRSPKSPPRSPSWMRLRESPTRTTCIRTRSPQVSPSEKYPSKLLDEPHHTGLPCSDEYREYEAYLDERRNPTTGLEATEGKIIGTADDDDSHTSLHLGNHFFSSSGGGYEDARASIDLASFAATVASGTAHLTNMSFSPPRPDEESLGTASGAVSAVDGILDDRLCLLAACEDKLEEQLTSVLATPGDRTVGLTDEGDVTEQPEDLSFLTSSLSVGSHWSGRLDLSPIPDVSPSEESAEVERTQPQVALRRTQSYDDHGAGSYGAKCIAETSPTFGSFKRCPSYHNILALPELEKPEPGLKLLEQTAALREERTGEVSGAETAVLPKLPEEQELWMEDDARAVENLEGIIEHSLFPFALAEKLVGEAGNMVEITEKEFSRSHGVYVMGIDGQEETDGKRWRNGSFENIGGNATKNYSSFEIDDKRNSSFGSVLTADPDEQVFLSDEELREIDLDEELPPKHLLVRKPKKSPFSVTVATPAISLSRPMDSPTEEIDSSLATSKPSSPTDLGETDVCPAEKDSVKDSATPLGKPFSRRKLPPVPLDLDTVGQGQTQGQIRGRNEGMRPNIVEHASDVGMETTKGRLQVEEKNHGHGSQDEGPKRVVVSSGPIEEELVSGRSSPMTKHRSKSNEEKSTIERSKVALKTRSVSADTKQTHRGSSRQRVVPDDIRSVTVKERPQSASGSFGEEENVASSVDLSVGIRNTTDKEDDSSQLDTCHRNLGTESSTSVADRLDTHRQADGTGPDISSVSLPVSRTDLCAETVDMAKNSFAPSVSTKPSATVESKLPESNEFRLRPKVPPKPPRPKTGEFGLAMVATVSLKYGLEVPVSVHGLQQRVKDEIKILTATRRLRLDEAEEIRILEAEFAERSKERKLKAGLRVSRLAPRDRISSSDDEYERGSVEREMGQTKCCGKREETLNYDDQETRKTGRSAASLTSPKQSKRPTSDPVFAKFSPIEEDGDAESVFLGKTLPDVGRPYASLDRQNLMPVQLGTSPSGTGHKALNEIPQQSPGILRHFLSRSTQVLHSGLLPESYSLGSLSASSFSFADHRSSSALLMDNDDAKGKEVRLHFLQTEIEKRRQHLSELAQRGAGPLSNVPGSLSPKSDPSARKQRDDSPDILSSRYAISSGLIKPIDYQINPENYYVRSKTGARQARGDSRTGVVEIGGDPAADSSVYSSFEYLTHKTEHAQKSIILAENVEVLFPSDVSYQGDYAQQSFAAPIEKDIIRYSESEDSLLYCPANYGSSRDSGVSSNMTGPDIYAFRSDHENTPPQEDFRCYPTGPARHDYYPPRDATTTPAMPLLGDVTSRSRSLLRDIGSRPLSDDLEKYFQVEEPMNLIRRDDSDYSVADSADDYIMEGGLTIRLNSERKPQRSVTTPRKYPFPTKRILLTSDPKERSTRGFGVKIVGGQYLPWAGEQLCAYVAYIFPGSGADQIHGELQEGDQVLELNGEALTGKSNEEVDQILAGCNCEVELVVRHGLNLRTFRSITMSTIHTDSNRSSYDNMATGSSFEGYESIDGLDREPTRLTSSGLRGQASSSLPQQQQQLYLGAGRSDYSPGTVPLQRSFAGSAEFKRRAIAQEDSPPDEGDKYVGEMQLQLSYDDYDGTLNVHIIQARNLRPKYKTGYSDPFVKVYLLPYRSSSECKRRTKCVTRTLNPEWHRTVVFLNIPQLELATKTLDISVWDHDRFMPNQFMGELLIDLSDESFLDNRPHWYQLSEECDNRYGKRPRTGTMSSSDSYQSSSSSRSRQPDREGPASSGGGDPGGLVRREGPRGYDHRPTLADSPSPYSFRGTSRTLSDSEESIAKRSCRYDDLAASSSRELSTVGQSGVGQPYSGDQQLTTAAVGRQDPVEQRLTCTDESWTDCSDRGHGLGFSRGQDVGYDRGQGLGYDSRLRNNERLRRHIGSRSRTEAEGDPPPFCMTSWTVKDKGKSSSSNASSFSSSSLHCQSRQSTSAKAFIVSSSSSSSSPSSFAVAINELR